MDISIKKEFEIALIFEKNENLIGAIDKYKSIVKKVPTHFESWLNLGAIYLNLNKRENALICFESCLKLKKDYRIYYNIGLIHYKMKRYTQAAEYFELCINLKMDFLPAYLLSGYTFTEQKMYNQAISTLQRGRKYCGDNESLLLCMAIAYHSSEDYSAGLEVLNKILAINPDNKTARKMKTYNLAKNPITDTAIQYFKNALKEDSVMQEIDKLINSQEHSQTLTKISQKKRDLICKKEKTSEDYLNLSLLSFFMGNGNAAMDFLSSCVPKK